MAYISQFLSECVKHIQNLASNILSVGIAIVLLFMCVTNEINAQNQVITSFPDSSFHRNERPLGNYAPLGGNRHRLTRNRTGEKTAIWWVSNPGSPTPHSMLDLSQDFVISFKLTFDSISYAVIGDGFTFCMTSQPTTNNLIGDRVWFIGYGTIQNSFAIEFDTEWGDRNVSDTPFGEGGPLQGSGCHTAYLKNGSMTALPGTYKPMLDNWAGVTGKTICVTIIWKRTNGVNSFGGYDLITYINNVERNNMHFAMLGSLISGLNPTNKYCNWGVTSANCTDSEHIVEFIKMENGYILFTSSHTIVFDGEGIPSDTFYIGGTNTIPLDCSTEPIPGQPAPTITYNVVPCYGDLGQLKISVLEGMDTAFAHWELENGGSWDSVGSGSKFPIRRIIDSIPNNADSLQIRLISGTDTIYFNIKYPKKITALKDYFIDSVFNNTDYIDYPVISDTFNVAMPTLDSGCSYSLENSEDIDFENFYCKKQGIN